MFLKEKENSSNIVIEATQTFSPGNVELLIYLLKELVANNFNITLYLGHSTTERIIKELNLSCLYIRKSLVLQTFIRSIYNRKNVLFFCSYPPLSKHQNSIVYYHSLFFFNPNETFFNQKITLKTKLSRVIIHFIIKFFHNKVDFFYCQTLEIKKRLQDNFHNINVECKPFYNDLELAAARDKLRNLRYDFFYPATADVHKNYFRLFDAVLLLGKKRKLTLVVTVSYDKLKFIDRITEVNSLLGYEAIINIGRVSKHEVIDYLIQTKAMIFPSLEESLGLPLIEAAVLNVPIMGSDLSYLYNVIENPIVFNPFNANDIAQKMENFLDGIYVGVAQKNKIENNIHEIVKYFRS